MSLTAKYRYIIHNSNVVIFYELISIIFVVFGEACNARKTSSSSFICVCNSTYCDTLPALDEVAEGTYQLFTSTPEGLRLHKENGQFSEDLEESLYRITIDRSTTHQTILGFGGAFTDSAGINIKSLPESAQEKLLRSYFSSDGSEYNLGRVPAGGTDFSSRGYTYADETEDSIDDFSLQHEDFDYKVMVRFKTESII